MFLIILALHVLICVGLIVVVLLQSGRGAGLASVFGGSGGGQSVFGGRGAAPFLVKATTVLAISFGLTSLTLAILSGTRKAPTSAIQKELGKERRAPSPPAAQPGTQGSEGNIPFPSEEKAGGGK